MDLIRLLFAELAEVLQTEKNAGEQHPVHDPSPPIQGPREEQKVRKVTQRTNPGGQEIGAKDQRPQPPASLLLNFSYRSERRFPLPRAQSL